MSAPRIAAILGTRPEVIKLSPVIRALQQAGDCTCVTVATGQQRELQLQAAAGFGLHLDHDLAVMTADQTLAGLTTRALSALSTVLDQVRPDFVLVQGDTTTALVGALAAFYRQTPVGHVEAGLRTGDNRAPYPEEANRRMIAALADLHFAPTPRARDNLLAEGIAPGTVHLTGNTVVDAVRLLSERQDRGLASPGPEAEALLKDLGRRALVLATVHRREQFGAGIEAICGALADLATRFPGVAFALPVHPNPQVGEPVRQALGAVPNVHLLAPLDHPSFLALLRRACLALTDSGGVQEEATALGCPTLILRDRTERHEAVECGIAELVGPHTEQIVTAGTRLLDDPELRRRRGAASQVFGDGDAGRRIAGLCLDYLAVPTARR